jgi:F-type H+-transporting ATPase subunit b
MLLLAGEPWYLNATTWVAVAFAILMVMFIRAGVPSMITKALDDRAAAISAEIAEARRLREDAEKLLADYKRKYAEAETEAKAIIDTARREADAMKAEADKTIAETIARRTKSAEDKIARAEAQAVNEVRSAVVETATAAAEKLLGEKTAGANGSALIDQSIRDLKTRLN